MEIRKYNIFFHLHTVSSIVITVGLYVIFFAGGFTLFHGSVSDWEKKTEAKVYQEHATSADVDFNKLITSLKKERYDLYGRDLYLYPDGENKFSLYVSGTADTSASEESKKDLRLTYDPATEKVSNQGGEKRFFTLSSLLYDLHFYNQLGDWGYYLSGVVALFFLFAIVTGVLIHWDKIVSNFFTFRPKEKLKTVWTDAHTALGTIGIPFQFIYALTGAMFGLGIVLALTGSILYEGDKDKFYEAVYEEHNDSLGVRQDVSSIDLNTFATQAKQRWENITPTDYALLKCESSTMKFRASGSVNAKEKFLTNGEVVYDVFTGKVTHEHDPAHKPYNEIVDVLFSLHFAYLGDIGTLQDYLLKTLYFLLTIATCFVIITGVLIWLEARNKKNVPEKEKRYNQRVGYIYLSICLTMLPVTALSFLVSKLLPSSVNEHREVILNSVYFGGWLLASIVFYFFRDNYRINKYTLLPSFVLGLCIPLVSGIVSNNWLWNTWSRRQYGVFVIDVLWLILSLICLYIVFKLKKKDIAG